MAALRLDQANVERYFPVVGVLESLDRTPAVLEHAIPEYFAGSLETFWAMPGY